MTLPPQNLDPNAKFVIAGAINLYVESRRRIDGRVLLTVEDVDPLFAICEALITQRPWSNAKLPEARSQDTTEEEREAIATVTETVAERMERRA